MYRYFTAHSNGSTVTLSWAASGACTPVSGFIAGSYGSGGTYEHWDDKITTQTGSLVDTPTRLPPGTPSIYCLVYPAYVLAIQGSGRQMPAFTSTGVQVC